VLTGHMTSSGDDRVARRKETKRWPVQDAKARFSELLEASLTEGPQIVTRRGVEMAVLLRVDQWRQMEEATRPRLKDLLLAAEPRAEISLPPRRARQFET
jgi:antitoxin Phd